MLCVLILFFHKFLSFVYLIFFYCCCTCIFFFFFIFLFCFFIYFLCISFSISMHFIRNFCTFPCLLLFYLLFCIFFSSFFFLFFIVLLLFTVFHTRKQTNVSQRHTQKIFQFNTLKGFFFLISLSIFLYLHHSA